MRLGRRTWRYLHRQRLDIGINVISLKKYSSISQNGVNKQPVFDPSKWDLLRVDRMFDSIGPRAVLQDSGVKLKHMTKIESLPEVALLGRTSVGKSSLINALLHNKKLARTSKTPGHTRLINCFNVGSQFYLVDLPGYGYVEGKGHGGQHFVNVVEQYLKERAGKQLRSVCLLVDGKVGIKETDLIAVEMLEEMNTPFHVVITKMDKVNKAAHGFIPTQIGKKIGELSTICFPHVFPVSSKEKTGLSELRYFISLSTGILQ